MSLVFVDTHVLLYSEDGADLAKQQRAIDWLGVLWTRRCGRLSQQVLNEFYAQATRQLRPPMPAGDARAEVRRYQRWSPWQIDHATVETAWAIESRFDLGYGDALALSAAQQQGCDWLLSEHLPHRLQVDGLCILNPFQVGPDVLDAPNP